MIFDETREMVKTWEELRAMREKLRAALAGTEDAMRHHEHEAARVLGFGNRDNTRAFGEPFLRNQAELIDQEETGGEEPQPPFDTREEARGER